MKIAAITLLALIIFASFADAQPGTRGEVAITIDDLPVVSIQKEFAPRLQITQKLLEVLKNENIPATGFVIGNRLLNDGKPDSNMVYLLKLWLNDGMELGNHTFSHKSLNNHDLDFYRDDVLKCHKLLGKILAGYGKHPVYFRQPYLQFGKDQNRIKLFYEFLKKYGYIMAPVTVDNADWIFARAYELAYIRKDSLMMKKVADTYIPYMKSKLEYYKAQSEKLFGYDIKQIMLIHASLLNSDNIGSLIKMIKESGYKIISLKEALKDKAYKHKDSYLGNAGISWLHRWAISEGKKGEFFKGEPVVPGFVMKYAGISSE